MQASAALMSFGDLYVGFITMAIQLVGCFQAAHALHVTSHLTNYFHIRG